MFHGEMKICTGFVDWYTLDQIARTILEALERAIIDRIARRPAPSKTRTVHIIFTHRNPWFLKENTQSVMNGLRTTDQCEDNLQHFKKVTR